jgi:hypothetical protein
MVTKSPSISSTVVQSGEELFDALSALPPLVHCRKCGSRLLQMNATFFSYGGKVWNLPLPVSTTCEPTQLSSGAPTYRHQQQPLQAFAQSTRKGIL